MVFADLMKKTELFTKENSSTILTAVGAVGTVATAVLTGRSTIKATLLIVDKGLEPDAPEEPPTKKEIVREVWPLYIPPVGVGLATVTSIIMANRLSSKKAAALAAAYGLSERAFQDYKEKVVQKLGATKDQAIRDEVAQDRVNSVPVTSQVIITGHGDVMCFDLLTGRYFKSNAEKIRRAENEVNREILDHEYASLSFFYDHVGLEPTQFSNDVGWNHENICEVQFSTVKSSDDQPCLAINFAIGPVQNFDKFH